jgi:hypothetical protein
MALEVPLTFAVQGTNDTSHGGSQNLHPAECEEHLQQLGQEVPVGEAKVHRRYLWKHPNREARVTLYVDGRVSFTHLTLGRPIQECCPHGNWKEANGVLSITFHHMANTSKQREHVFMQYDDAIDVWYLSGHFDATNAADFAFLQPWVDRYVRGPPVIFRWN